MNREKEWDRQQTIELINALQNHPCIWDVNAEYHRDKRKKYESYAELANMFECSNNDIERKVAALRAGYRRELKKEMAAVAAGQDCYKTKWIFYKHMSFLHPKNINSEEIEDDSYETPQTFDYEAQISDEDNTACSEKTKKKKRSHSSICDQKFYNETTKLLKLIQDASQQRTEAGGEYKDDCETFGASIAAQLRNLQSNYAKSSAKLNIQKALFEAEQLDMNILRPPAPLFNNTKTAPTLPQPSVISPKPPTFITNPHPVFSDKTASSERSVSAPMPVLSKKTGPLVMNTSAPGNEFPQAQHFLICTKTKSVKK